MRKVFLVEDEIVMREGIRNNIDWAREGFLFGGEASDGELAYPRICETCPDILITDIRMPFMDGLELSRLVKKELPGTKIIILSGYDDFAYAKQAISIGVTEYLVKPISGAQLLESVKKVAALLDEEEKQKEFLRTYEKEREENVQHARQRLFGDVVSGRKAVSELLEQGRQLGVNLSAKRYNVVLFQLYTQGDVDGYSEERNAFTETMEALASGNILVFERDLDGWAFLFQENEGESLEETQQTFLSRLVETVDSYGDGVEYFVGTGCPVERLGELKKSFEAASRAFAYRYLVSHNRIVSDEEPVAAILDRDSINMLEVNRPDRALVENFLKTGAKSEVADFVDGYMESLGNQNVQSFLFRQYVAMDIWFVAMGMLRQFGQPAGRIVEKYGSSEEMLASFSNVEQTRTFVCEVLTSVIEVREQASQRKYSALLKTAKSYIQNHYSNSDLSLNMVAASVNLSPSYFSSIFSQENGQTFIEYLTSVRMEKAKELLRSTSMRATDIAFEVGYNDPHYFSYIFKKTQDCSPREFRNSAMTSKK